VATDAENIATRLGRIYAELAGLKTIAADARAQFTYTEGQSTYDYDGYVRRLLEEARELEELWVKVNIRASGPFDVKQVVRG
jgi:hypothetical protein